MVGEAARPSARDRTLVLTWSSHDRNNGAIFARAGSHWGTGRDDAVRGNRGRRHPGYTRGGASCRCLAEHPWAIVTSAWRMLAEARVVAAGLPLPNVIVPVDEIRNGKPDPEGYLCAAEQLGVPPQECLVFEDTRPGIEAGLNAGMHVVGLLTTMPADQLRHRPLIRDFREVTIRPEGDRLNVEITEAI